MPTGYTAAVKDGISFEQFTWGCARAFGALVMMRDDPSDAKVPEAFEPSDFYTKSLATAQERIAALQAMTPDQAGNAAIDAYKAAEKRFVERLAEKQGLLNKYNEMLAKVEKWAPPTPDHRGLKSFMLEQLQQSIDFDCSTDYEKPPLMLDGATWLARAIAEAGKEIARYSEMQAEEVARTNDRNNWIKALRESVPPPVA